MSAAQHEQYIAVLKAIYDYEPSAEDEVSLKEDQVVFLLERVDDEWWRVKHKTEATDEDNAASGLVPASYVEEVPAKSVAKAIYDYEAAAKGELSISEDEELVIYDQEDEWLLVKTERDGGLVGYVPITYVEETNGEQAEEPEQNDLSQIVVPDSPPLPPSAPYVDPADLVASKADRAKADDIKTWALSEVDKKGKKKKGTLGIGNGAIFFASESDKTPVQQWQTADVGDIKVEKSKHVHIEIGGPTPISLHFNAGSKDVADAIVTKLEASQRAANGAISPPARQISPLSTSRTSPIDEDDNKEETPQKPIRKAAVHFAPAPAVIPPSETADDDVDDYESVADGEEAYALYEFNAEGEDELPVKPGERLFVLDRVSSPDWWKCRNAYGAEGVVPATFVELTGGQAETTAQAEDEEAERLAREEAEREAAEREAAEREAADVETREAARREQEANKREAEQRAKAAAARAEQERKEREAKATREREERAAREREAKEAEQRAEQRAARKAEKASRAERSNRSDEATPKKFPNEGKTRIWHDHSGQWKTEAEFVGISKGKVRLHKINGVIIEVPPEKMAPADVQFIEHITNKKLLPSMSAASSSSKPKDDDDIPLGALPSRRPQGESSSPRPQVPPKKRSNVDWFEFFLNAGCEVDDCSRYASAFERDKIDEAILPDIKESTLRSLGLREGDIIRVTKAIEQRKSRAGGSKEEEKDSKQLEADEKLAAALQDEEYKKAGIRNNTASPPNLFTVGPGGGLKPRRGRPSRGGSAPPVNVDASALATASDQISRSESPLVSSPSTLRAASPAVALVKPTLSTQSSGFDDDAWTNRPSSTRPTPSPAPAAIQTALPTSPPPVAVIPAPPTPAPAPPPPPPPPASAPPASVPAPAAFSAAPVSQSQQPSQNDTQAQILSKIQSLRPPSAPLPQSPANSLSPQPAAVPQSYVSGLGFGSSPVPIGQHLQNQQTGLYQIPGNGPRGPLAPVPSNQGLLNPLVPAIGINQFIPTRPTSNPPFQTLSTQATGFQSSQPSFLSSPPPGYGGGSPLLPQQTGFPGLGPSNGTFGNFTGIAPQPTGFVNGFTPTGANNFQSQNSFGGLNAQPTGFNPGFNPNVNSGFSPNANTTFNPNVNSGFNPGFNSNVNSGFSPQNSGLPGLPNFLPPPGRAASPPKDHSPANIFAQMKAGTFADDTAPQPSDKYDALRAQPTGWQGYGGY
ncbi:hypothetical protein M422DRAFT_62777 [Sphaerobolus stellatus SS14]|nr:hypothetical protein M422DRAFT_62777 [Sphaerobolus stellatus SS14]